MKKPKLWTDFKRKKTAHQYNPNPLDCKKEQANDSHTYRFPDNKKNCLCSEVSHMNHELFLEYWRSAQNPFSNTTRRQLKT